MDSASISEHLKLNYFLIEFFTHSSNMWKVASLDCMIIDFMCIFRVGGIPNFAYLIIMSGYFVDLQNKFENSKHFEICVVFLPPHMHCMLAFSA